MNEIKEFDVVLLNVDLPEYNLVKDQIGTVVAVFSKGTAFEVVFSDDQGKVIESLGLHLEQIRKK